MEYFACIRMPCAHRAACLQMVMPTQEGPFVWGYLAVASVMHPACAVRTRWDVYILILMLVLCLVTPYTIGFDLEPRNDSVIGVFLSQNFPVGCMVHSVFCWRGSVGAADAASNEFLLTLYGAEFSTRTCLEYATLFSHVPAGLLHAIVSTHIGAPPCGSANP